MHHSRTSWPSSVPAFRPICVSKPPTRSICLPANRHVHAERHGAPKRRGVRPVVEQRDDGPHPAIRSRNPPRRLRLPDRQDSAADVVALFLVARPNSMWSSQSGSTRTSSSVVTRISPAAMWNPWLSGGAATLLPFERGTQPHGKRPLPAASTTSRVLSGEFVVDDHHPPTARSIGGAQQALQCVPQHGGAVRASR